MSNEINRIAEIKLNVSLNQDNVPVALHWQSDDNPDTLNNTECKAFMLSIFDKTHRDTLKIDLWTDEMQIIEMDRFFYQTLRGMADTYLRATKNKELANAFQQFTQYFGEQTEIIPKV
jgi:gliding motility-associated protein GldC